MLSSISNGLAYLCIGPLVDGNPQLQCRVYTRDKADLSAVRSPQSARYYKIGGRGLCFICKKTGIKIGPSDTINLEILDPQLANWLMDLDYTFERWASLKCKVEST